MFIFAESPLHRKTISGPTRNLFDVALTRKDGEGFGFVIVSSVTKAGSIVGKCVNCFDLSSFAIN